MTRFMEATLERGFFDARPAEAPAHVRVAMDGRILTLLIPGKDGEQAWRGERRGQGHFVMSGVDPAAGGTLHRFADSTILEGFWRNGSERGFWRLQLPDATPALLQPRAPNDEATAVRRRRDAVASAMN